MGKILGGRRHRPKAREYNTKNTKKLVLRPDAVSLFPLWPGSTRSLPSHMSAFALTSSCLHSLVVPRRVLSFRVFKTRLWVRLEDAASFAIHLPRRAWRRLGDALFSQDAPKTRSNFKTRLCWSSRRGFFSQRDWFHCRLWRAGLLLS